MRLLFIKAGDSLNARRVAKLLNVSPPAVAKALPFLEKQKLISLEQDKTSKRWSIEFNRSNYKAMQLKRADNLKQIYESGLAYFLEKEFAGATIVLFGSYSRGEDTITSDIDIAIMGRKEKDVNLSYFDKTLERKVSLAFYKSFKEIHKNLRENICNGIVLIGGVDL